MDADVRRTIRDWRHATRLGFWADRERDCLWLAAHWNGRESLLWPVTHDGFPLEHWLVTLDDGVALDGGDR